MTKQVIFLGARRAGLECLNILGQYCNEENHEITGALFSGANKNMKKKFKYVCKKYDIDVLKELPKAENISKNDIMLSVQHDSIVPQKVLSEVSEVSVNLHMAPLPEYRGCNQFSFAIIDNADIFGTTFHVMDPEVDSGDIIFERRFSVPKKCWVKDLYDITTHESVIMFKNKIGNIIEGRYSKTPQKKLIEERGTSYHYRKEIEDIKEINLSWSKERIQRHIRATSMPGYPPPYTIVDGRKVSLKLRK